MPNLSKGATKMKNNTARKFREIPSGYLVTGVDSHKKKHAEVAMTEDFMGRSKFKFTNSMACK